MSVVLVVVVGLLGGYVQVPYVALGPGPSYNTLGNDGPDPVVRVDGHPTFPTAGNLNMTTVSVTDQISLFGALGMWASGDYALAPRELYFPPGKTEQQVEQENTEEFNDSQSQAETAALAHLHYPMKVVVGQLVRGTPADGALRPGDRLNTVDGRPVTDPASVTGIVAAHRPGDRIEIGFQRAAEPPRTASVQLADNPHRPGAGFLGISPATRPDVPFHISIKLADVGGPSAGLMFALAIIDKLTPGELNGGHFVAGTGEIDDRGQVGRIGGIPFKLTRAREAGATEFLVPEGNCSEAKAQAPDGLRLIRISTLDDAVHALDALRTGQAPPSC